MEVSHRCQMMLNWKLLFPRLIFQALLHTYHRTIQGARFLVLYLCMFDSRSLLDTEMQLDFVRFHSVNNLRISANCFLIHLLHQQNNGIFHPLLSIKLKKREFIANNHSALIAHKATILKKMKCSNMSQRKRNR